MHYALSPNPQPLKLHLNISKLAVWEAFFALRIHGPTGNKFWWGKVKTPSTAADAAAMLRERAATVAREEEEALDHKFGVGDENPGLGA